MVLEILADEVEHEDDLQIMLEDFKSVKFAQGLLKNNLEFLYSNCDK